MAGFGKAGYIHITAIIIMDFWLYCSYNTVGIGYLYYCSNNKNARVQALPRKSVNNEDILLWYHWLQFHEWLHSLCYSNLQTYNKMHMVQINLMFRHLLCNTHLTLLLMLMYVNPWNFFSLFKGGFRVGTKGASALLQSSCVS